MNQSASIDKTGPPPETTEELSAGEPVSAVHQQDVTAPLALSVPANLLLQAPSRIFSQKQSSFQASQLRPLSPERNKPPPDASTLPNTSTPDRLPRLATQDSQVLRQSQGISATQRTSKDHAVPDIPKWVPPHPSFSRSRQTDDTTTSDVRTRLFTKPSR